jgi:hypothetical protein
VPDAPSVSTIAGRRARARFGPRLVAIPFASLALGFATSYAQTVLPSAFASFANSASGWTILTAALVLQARPTLGIGALAGAVSFVCLVLGYTLASELRGYAYTPALWLVVSLVAGPLVGAAAAAMRHPSRVTAAVGALAIAAVLAADGVRGLTVLAGSTSPVYWTLMVVLGLALVVWAAIQLFARRRGA